MSQMPQTKQSRRLQTSVTAKQQNTHSYIKQHNTAIEESKRRHPKPGLTSVPSPCTKIKQNSLYNSIRDVRESTQSAKQCNKMKYIYIYTLYKYSFGFYCLHGCPKASKALLLCSVQNPRVASISTLLGQHHPALSWVGKANTVMKRLLQDSV